MCKAQTHSHYCRNCDRNLTFSNSHESTRLSYPKSEILKFLSARPGKQQLLTQSTEYKPPPFWSILESLKKIHNVSCHLYKAPTFLNIRPHKGVVLIVCQSSWNLNVTCIGSLTSHAPPSSCLLGSLPSVARTVTFQCMKNRWLVSQCHFIPISVEYDYFSFKELYSAFRDPLLLPDKSGFSLKPVSPCNLFFQVIDVFVNCFVWCNYCLLDQIAIMLLNPQIAAGYIVQSNYEDHEAWLQGGKVTVTRHKMSRIHNYSLNSVHPCFFSNWKKK